MDDLIEALEKIKQDVQRMHYELECLQAEKKNVVLPIGWRIIPGGKKR